VAKPRKKPRRYQQVLVVLAGLGIVTISAAPVTAQLSEIGSLANSLFSLAGIDISGYTEYLDKAAEFYGAIENGNLEGVLDGATYALGELGYPLAGETPTAINDAAKLVANDPNPFGFTSNEVGAALGAAEDKALSDSQAEIQLGEQGQQIIADAKETMAMLAANSNSVAESAQALTNTQDVVKQLTLQNAFSAAMLQGIYSEILQQRINSVFDNENTAVLANQAQREVWRQRILNQGTLPYLTNISGSSWGYGSTSSSTLNQTSLFP
jgi:hypothetical protein